MNNYLIIPVSLDYGAEEYICNSPFITVDELKKWWFSDFDLSKF